MWEGGMVGGHVRATRESLSPEINVNRPNDKVEPNK